MAANEYYNTSTSNHHIAQQQNDLSPPSPPPASTKPPTSLYTNYPLNSPYSATGGPLDSPYDNSRYSRDSSYQGVAGGTLQDDRQYADNIPLKSSNPRPYSEDHLVGQNTQYPPSPESQHPSKSSRRRKKKQGWFSGKITWVVFVVTLVQIGVFIGEIIRNCESHAFISVDVTNRCFKATKTGSPIMIQPSFNPMIGPSPYVLINMGARFVPCMRETEDTRGLKLPCPETTSSNPQDQVNNCPLAKVCGFGAQENASPLSQWYRFIIPMFLHGGLIHIGFNMLLQLTMGREMELVIGSFRFALVYFSSGIFGFVLGGNFAPPMIASTGASGCLFGILALVLLDLIYSWNERPKPGRELLIILLDIVISFVLGLLPGLDNFSHIGGFLMGLVLGICILHSPNALRQRIGVASTPYEPMASGRAQQVGGIGTFAKGPIGFFKGRKPAWWAWWLLRAGALVGVLVSFIVLLNNFYVYKKGCNWCKHLTCLPVSNWCDIGQIRPMESGSSKMRRGLLTTALHLGGDLFGRARG
jgi:membrane associated rhomboid family serine protease